MPLSSVKKRIKQSYPLASGRSSKSSFINWDKMVFLGAQLAKRPVDYFQEEINSKKIIGQQSKRPIQIEIPIVIAAMSFGALSKKAKMILAKAATLVGTAANTGEGGMLPEERKLARILIAQYSTGRFGVDEEYLQKADAIEIKIGQGAKPGQGGLLPSSKITPEIARIRKIKKNQTIHSPAAHPDIKNIKDLKNKIKWLRKITDGKPIILKLAAGDLEKDIPLAVKADPDIIAIDGLEGGTGAAPEVMLEAVGLPTLPALVRTRKILDQLKARQELWIGGGFQKGEDVAKAIALGADVVFMGTALLEAMGCLKCGLCYLGHCPVGIATQNPALIKKLNFNQAVEQVSNFLKNCTEEVKQIAGACGYRNIYDLNRDDLRVLDPFIAQITGLKTV